VGKFEAVTECSAGRENRIPQAQRANSYAEVNGSSGTHFVEENNTKPGRAPRKIGHLTARPLSLILSPQEKNFFGAK
jgi:hypothetical protein